MIKTDEYGFRYYDQLPENAKLIKTVWHFVTIEPLIWGHYTLNTGMEYLIQSQDGNRYYICKISQYSKDVNLIQYINSSQIFIVS